MIFNSACKNEEQTTGVNKKVMMARDYCQKFAICGRLMLSSTIISCMVQWIPFYFVLSCWEHALRPNLVLGNHICCVSWYCWIVTSSVNSFSSALASQRGLERRSIDVVDLDVIVKRPPEIRFTFVSSTLKLSRKSMGEHFRLSHRAHSLFSWGQNSWRSSPYKWRFISISISNISHESEASSVSLPPLLRLIR